MKSRFNAVLAFAGGICLFYYAFLISEPPVPDFSFIWAAAGSLMLLKGLICLLIRPAKGKILKCLFRVFDISAALLAALSAVYFICAVLCMGSQAPDGCGCVIVPGAAVIYDEPSEMLRDRINTAFEYLERNPDTDVICTGGKSGEDIISEGECIAENLKKMGIGQERIFTENQSSTTVENIRFSLEYLEKYDSAVVVTGGFHVMRCRFIASRLAGIKTYSVPSSGFSAYTPHYIVRECAAFTVDFFLGNYKNK